MKSIVYWHPTIYSFLIRLSYGKNYAERYEAIKNLIDPGSSVVDVCCGDCKIYSFLKDKKMEYTGLDFNPYFIKIANKRGIKAKVFNLYLDDIPQADYVIMQGSLYQFISEHYKILMKMFTAASKYLIISEPVRNKANSRFKIIAFVAEKMSDPGDGIKKFKFDIKKMREILEPFKNNIEKELLVAENTDYIALIKK